MDMDTAVIEPTVLYLCDRKDCGGECPNELCKHTSDIRHAKNFVNGFDEKLGETLFYEVERS